MNVTEEEIGYLIRAGHIKLDELRETEPDPPEAEDTRLLDGLERVVKAVEASRDKTAPAASASIVIPAPQVTVNVPRRGSYVATVTERDKDGYIKRVKFEEVA